MIKLFCQQRSWALRLCCSWSWSKYSFYSVVLTCCYFIVRWRDLNVLRTQSNPNMPGSTTLPYRFVLPLDVKDCTVGKVLKRICHNFTVEAEQCALNFIYVCRWSIECSKVFTFHIILRRRRVKIWLATRLASILFTIVQTSYVQPK